MRSTNTGHYPSMKVPALTFSLFLLATTGFGADDPDKMRLEAHQLRAAAHQAHDQALHDIEDADAKQVAAEEDFKKAAQLDKKADEVEKISPERQRANALREHAHQNMRAASAAEARAKLHKSRAEAETAGIRNGEHVLTELKDKKADPMEIRLIEDDVHENRARVVAEDDEKKRLEESAEKLRKSASDELAQADKIDPEGKERDAKEHPNRK